MSSLSDLQQVEAPSNLWIMYVQRERAKLWSTQNGSIWCVSCFEGVETPDMGSTFPS